MSANEASLDNWINEAIATQLPELRMSLSTEDSELLAKLVREIAQSSNVSIVFSLVDACGQQRFSSAWITPCWSAIPWHHKGTDRGSSQNANSRTGNAGTAGW